MPKVQLEGVTAKPPGGRTCAGELLGIRRITHNVQLTTIFKNCPAVTLKFDGFSPSALDCAFPVSRTFVPQRLRTRSQEPERGAHHGAHVLKAFAAAA
jgi:hypothetical protein